LDEHSLARNTQEQIERQVQHAFQQTQGQRLIIAPAVRYRCKQTRASWKTVRQASENSPVEM